MSVRSPLDLESSLRSDSEARSTDIVRVVLADPHAISRSGTRRILEMEHGIEIVGEAVSLAAALSLVEVLGPDVVLLAVSPADLENRTFARQLRGLLDRTQVLVLEHGVSPQRLSRVGVTAWVGGTASPVELVAGVRATAEGRSVYGNPTSISDREGDEVKRPTPREQEVLVLVEQGLATRAIADQLRTTPRTIHFHIGNLYTKLGASSRTEMVYLARQRGWLE